MVYLLLPSLLPFKEYQCLSLWQKAHQIPSVPLSVPFLSQAPISSVSLWHDTWGVFHDSAIPPNTLCFTEFYHTRVSLHLRRINLLHDLRLVLYTASQAATVSRLGFFLVSSNLPCSFKISFSCLSKIFASSKRKHLGHRAGLVICTVCTTIAGASRLPSALKGQRVTIWRLR